MEETARQGKGFRLGYFGQGGEIIKKKKLLVKALREAKATPIQVRMAAILLAVNDLENALEFVAMIRKEERYVHGRNERNLIIEAKNILLTHEQFGCCCECEKLTLSKLECRRCEEVICDKCADSLHEDRAGHVFCSICKGS